MSTVSSTETSVTSSEPDATVFDSEVLVVAERFGVRHVLPQLYVEAMRLFKGQVDVALEWDPEIPDYPKITFDVLTTSGEVHEFDAREDEWYRKGSELAGSNCLLFILIVHRAT